MAAKKKVKCLVSFFINGKDGKLELSGKRGKVIEVTDAQARKLIAEKQAVEAGSVVEEDAPEE